MRQGLGMEEAANAAGITRSYLSRLETGTASGRMRPDTYVALRTALRATDNDLLQPPEAPPETR
jgi:transcriptional regulator with XRE-family HTH domain